MNLHKELEIREKEVSLWETFICNLSKSFNDKENKLDGIYKNINEFKMKQGIIQKEI